MQSFFAGRALYMIEFKAEILLLKPNICTAMCSIRQRTGLYLYYPLILLGLVVSFSIFPLDTLV